MMTENEFNARLEGLEIIALAQRNLKAALGVLVSTLGGTVTIPAEVLAAAPPIRWETAEDGTVTITTGEESK
jgi:hypothetical protein